MIFFDLEQVMNLHSSLIAKTGGMDGIRDKNLLDSALKSPFQTFSGKELYPSIFDKAAQLCYSLVENHPFADGNKRIAATLFIYFLNFYGILYKNGKQVIDNNTLTALTLLIAESNPKEKEVIIDLVMNFLNNE